MISFESELTALRSSLEHAYREQQISQRQYLERCTILENLDAEVLSLKSLYGDQEEPEEQIVKNLPLLTKLNAKETAITVGFLERKYHYLLQVKEQLDKVLMWSEKASQGRMIPFMASYRLSQLNKIMSRLEAASQSLKDDDIELNQYIDQLSVRLGLSNPDNPRQRDRLSAIIKLLENHEKSELKLRETQEKISELEHEIFELQTVARDKMNQRGFDSIYSGIPTPQNSKSARHGLIGSYQEKLDACQEKTQVISEFINAALEDAPHDFTGGHL